MTCSRPRSASGVGSLFKCRSRARVCLRPSLWTGAGACLRLRRSRILRASGPAGMVACVTALWWARVRGGAWPERAVAGGRLGVASRGAGGPAARRRRRRPHGRGPQRWAHRRIAFGVVGGGGDGVDGMGGSADSGLARAAAGFGDQKVGRKGPAAVAQLAGRLGRGGPGGSLASLQPSALSVHWRGAGAVP